MESTEENKTKKVVLHGVLAEFREALEEEEKAIKRNGQSSTLLYEGKNLGLHGSGSWWYAFHVDYLPAMPADTPCQLWVGKDVFDVTVIGLEEDTVTLASQKPLPATIAAAKLENSAAVLLERLIQCIEDNATVPNRAGGWMLPPEGGIYQAKKIFSCTDLDTEKSNTESQNRAVAEAVTNDITYIWGPPGTGKTTVIGQIVKQLYQSGRSVLMVSHTNTAVDGAMEKADSCCAGAQSGDGTVPYPILRLGTPFRKLPEHMSLKAHVTQKGQMLYQRKAKLEAQCKAWQARLQEIARRLARYAWMQNNQVQQIAQDLQNIDILAAQRKTLQQEMEKEEAALQQAGPVWENRSTVQAAWKKQKNAYDQICQQVVDAETTIREGPARRQQALDEAGKHDIYARLEQKAATYLSMDFLEKAVQTSSTQEESLRAEIRTLKERKKEAEDCIAAYQKKSALARFFANSQKIRQAEQIVQATAARLPEAEEARQRQEKLAQQYREQRKEKGLLQAQMEMVRPSRTKADWLTEADKWQRAWETAKSVLPVLMERKSEQEAALEPLTEQKRQVEQAGRRVKTIENTCQRLREEQDVVSRRYQYAQDQCTAHLEQECARCAGFADICREEPPAEQFAALESLLQTVRQEMAQADIPALHREKEKLEQMLRAAQEEQEALRQKIDLLEEKVITEAKIVGTTLTRTYLSAQLRKRTFDTVILDEASMASIPALWCAAALAERGLVIVGDFLQLPPIVMAKTPMAQKWLGKDIFYHSGMAQLAKDPNTCPENFVMLNDQFRMESDIADIANMYYGAYGGLRSHDDAPGRVESRAAFYSWYPEKAETGNIHLIDTESLHAWVTGVPQGKGHSRINSFSAVIDVALAFSLVEDKLRGLDPASAKPVQEPLVWIVCPYKPHTVRIQQLLDLAYQERGFTQNLQYIRASTIHSVQGGEADIVIFDLVVDEPHHRANLFMPDGEDGGTLRQQFNVAITRARFKLYLVGNFSYCRKRAGHNALGELLDRLLLQKQLPRREAKTLFPMVAYAPRHRDDCGQIRPGTYLSCREDTFYTHFMADVQTFQKRLILYSPFMTENRLSMLLPAFVDAVHAGKEILVVTKDLSDRGKRELTQYQKCEQELRRIGVTVLHKKGMHEKLVFVDSRAIWIGSLNVLSFTGNTGEIMTRLADTAIVHKYEKDYTIPPICHVAEDATEQRCPVCGGEMVIREGAEGGIYWACIRGDYTRNTEQAYPVDGILRCKCGAPYRFAMKQQPRWVCTQNVRHYQKVRLADLKLSKMAALIPKKDRKAVQAYFADRQVEKTETSSRDTETSLAENKGTFPGHGAHFQEEKAEQLSLYEMAAPAKEDMGEQL